MSSLSPNLEVEQLACLLQEKTALYNQMIDDNKEFDDVKALFLEIKDIVALLSRLPEPETHVTLHNFHQDKTHDQ